jgi:hypothetical protein
MEDTKQHATFAGKFTTSRPGKSEILAMTAGEGNGWIIDAAVLQASQGLWEKANSFIDHTWMGHSVRDLCGVLTDVQWDEENQGIKATFNPFGPGADIAAQVAQDALDNPDLASGVGFSADIYFTFTGKHVDAIVGVNSVDLVIDPARGGKWLRALNSVGAQYIVPGKEPMTDQTQISGPPDAGAQMALIEANKQIETLKVQMCASVLQSTLAASNLPAPLQERIRTDFSGKTFEPADLTARVDADRSLLSALTAGSAVQGQARISGMFSAEDQLKAAVDDMFGVERDAEYKNVKPARLTGIRELYHLLTGDYDLRGGIFPERSQFQLTTANFPIIVKNALNKALCSAWAEFGKAGYNWWEPISTIQHFSNLNQITWSIFGTVATLPTVAEGAEYTPLMLGDSGETSSFVKKGGYLGITLEAIDRDDMRALLAAPKELAFAAIREISALVAALFTDNSNVGPTLADTGALFNNVAVTTLGGHANLLTTALGTTYVAWEAMASAMYNQPMLVANEATYYGTGKKMAVDPKFLLVPRALRGAANDLFLSRDIPGANITLTTGREWYGMVIPLTVPEWTDATDWAAVADPRLMPAIMIGERFGIVPEIFIAGNETDPAVFMNDESRIKVRHFTAVGVCDFRPLHKNNVV